MTQSPLNESQLAELAEIVELAKTTEQQSQEVCDLAVAISKKCQTRLCRAKLTTSQQQLDGGDLR